jgi:hypothetical protein
VGKLEELIGKGRSTAAKAEVKKPKPNHLKAAIKEAWQASKDDDFDAFSSAMESVVKIAHHSEKEE